MSDETQNSNQTAAPVVQGVVMPLSDICDVIWQCKEANEKERGKSGNGEQWENGYLAAHDAIIATLQSGAQTITEAEKDENRLLFEDWAHNKGMVLDTAFFAEDENNYVNPDTHLAYEIWLASRAAA